MILLPASARGTMSSIRCPGLDNVSDCESGFLFTFTISVIPDCRACIETGQPCAGGTMNTDDC
jgi:hypothetical protein